MAFFESFSYLIAKMDNINKDEICKAYSLMLGNTEYVDSLTYSVDSRKQTHLRYEMINSYLRKNEQNVERV